MLAQDWIWVKGSSTGNSPGTFGTKGIEDAANTPPGLESPAAVCDNSGEFWIFGGHGLISTNWGYSSDLWKFNPQSKNWTWMHGTKAPNPAGAYGTLGIADPNNIPPCREKAVMWIDNSNNLWLFGGKSWIGNDFYYNDLWKYDINTGNWTWIKGSNTPNSPGVYGTIGVANAANNPGARAGSTTWIDDTGNLWLFGGYGYTSSANITQLNDLWKYDVATGNWTWIMGDQFSPGGSYGTKKIASTYNRPGARQDAVGWKDNDGNLWLFGGWGYDASVYALLGDLWKYNVASGLWTWVSGGSTGDQNGIYGTRGIPSSANFPGSRQSASGCKDEFNNLWLFGGSGFPASGSSGDLNDLWFYNIQSDQWTWVKGSSNKNPAGVYGTKNVPDSLNTPANKYSAVMLNDKVGNLWVFAGVYSFENSGYLMNDLWSIDITEIVPVELVSFNASVENFNVTLRWSTASELNNKEYIIERKQQGESAWLNVGKIEGKGTTSQLSNYILIDKNIIPGSYIYRLKQIDFDGSYSYSREAFVTVDALPEDFSLEQNYPNPFNPATKIKFSIVESGLVTLKVYNLLGQEVVTLVNETLNSGVYNIDFDASSAAGGLTSGTYLYKITAGNFSSSKKMLLVK